MQNNSVLIVMYHYIREIKDSRFPDIKGLEVDHFKHQVKYLIRNYQPISAFDLIDAIKGTKKLPTDAVLLTFDDGYLDHFTSVFPILEEAGISGCFFPCAKSVLENKVLDVNKIHFTLSSVTDKTLLVEAINEQIRYYSKEFNLKTIEEYWLKLGKPSRYDSSDVMYIKRMLQVELPESLRNLISDKLFKEFVTDNEVSFSKELYMNLDQIRCMNRHGHYFGSHGYNHSWLNDLDSTKQAKEIQLSLEFLRMINPKMKDWIMCYPYGGYDESLISILQSSGCVAGLTTKAEVSDLIKHNRFSLPRLDTNDLPKNADAPRLI